VKLIAYFRGYAPDGVVPQIAVKDFGVSAASALGLPNRQE
jgi:hypothetical protein